MENSILMQNVTPKEFAELISDGVKTQLGDFKKELQIKLNSEELLTRTETCEYLKIDPSTLWHWTNKNKVKAYGIGNRRYYKRSELLESLKLLRNNE